MYLQKKFNVKATMLTIIYLFICSINSFLILFLLVIKSNFPNFFGHCLAKGKWRV
jgi:hypothetical protein